MLSIIVPVYNVSDYLPGCLDSILANELTDCEIVLVDDGSTDGKSGQLCDEYAAAHPELIRVIHQENGGLGAARNSGMAAAKGDWFFFVDSDDKIDASSVAVLKRAIAASDAQIIGFRFYADDGTNPPTPQGTGFEPVAGPFTLEERPDYLLSLPSAWLRIWRRELFERSGITFPSRVWYEDIRTTAKLLPLAKGITVLPDHLYYYLSRPGSIMNNAKLERNREILDAMDDVLGWYREQGLFERYRPQLRALTVQHVMLAASVRVARADPKHPLLKEFYDYTETAFPDWRDDPASRTLPRMKRLALALVAKKRYRLLRLLFKMKG